MAKTIAVIATLDTKGDEAWFVREQIERRGHRALLIDPGILGETAVQAEICRDEVARAGGATSLEAVRGCGSKQQAMETMVRGTTKLLVGLVASREVDAVIGIGGGAGTSIATAAMRALPLGFPKLMVSTIAAGKHYFGTFMGTKDLTMMHSVADILGLNPIVRKVLANGAAAICGMAEVEMEIERGEKPVVLATMFGTTTPCLMKAKILLEARGHEVVMFHPNGTGGPAMEELIEQGVGDAVLDLSAHEISGYLFKDIMGAPNRLEAAGRRGLPQVVGPGGNDFLVLGPPDELAPEHRHRKQYRHTPEMTLCRVTPEEMVAVAKVIAERLNRASGPSGVVVPLRGFSFPSREGYPLYDPEGDLSFARTIREELSEGVRYVEVDCHINDPPYAEMAVSMLEELIGESRPASD
jgi:uncharacterized protein (UPF0261 family)